VKAFEAAYADEVQLRKEVEDKVENTRQEQEQILKQVEDLSREWQTTMRNVSLLESHCTEANCHENEASRKLKLIQMSVTTLQDETKNMRRQKEQAMQHLEWWRNHLRVRISNDVDFGFINTSAEYKHFSLFDLQIATCNFSESFIIGQGSYGCVYKGEISDRSVAIKKLNPFNMQDAPEFQQEVERLSKLKHTRLVTLIGACPEAYSLVYEYLPNGSIEDHLFRKTNNPLTWKKRTHIVADMSSALLYLHSCKPGKTIHGNLKPKNILLDQEFNCKIGDFMIGQLVPKKTARCPSFRGITEMESVFPYIDPELHTFQDLTPKSDIYALGVIILQLLTGRSPMGLASEVRRAVLCGNLTSILDTSAGEWPTFVTRRLVEFGLQCCELKGRDRPELEPALVMGLEKLHLAEGQPVPSFLLCPILKELMYDPHVAADGFTYEGEAIRGWLKGGRGTSPMTNLTLSHFSLTPNHALRSAIQDWLCRS
ncbi:U-box domain-containing protein, partial [Thalictrum thalictroides]